MAGPGRAPTSRDVLHSLTGTPVYLGVLVSTGAAVNNATTATPFSTGMPGAAATNFLNTLSGKTLLCVPSAAGYVLPAPSSALVIAPMSLPIAVNATPGISVSESEWVKIEMQPGSGWLQWLPFTAGNLWIWELA